MIKYREIVVLLNRKTNIWPYKSLYCQESPEFTSEMMLIWTIDSSLIALEFFNYL